MSVRQCAICGKPLPEGSAAARKFCNECGTAHRKEIEKQRRDERRKLEREVAAAQPQQQKPIKTLNEKDKR